jgi:hypothetical protein
MRETLLGQGFATEAAFGALEYAWEKLPPSELGAIRPSSRSPIHRGKLIKVQIGEKLRSGMAAPQGSHRKWDREFESGLLQRRV